MLSSVSPTVTTAASAAVEPSLLRIHSVEIQLVCHFLDTISLLSLARSNRHCLADCSDAFAWQHAPLVHIRLQLQGENGQPLLPTAAEGASSLLRHCSLALLADVKFLPLLVREWPLPVHALRVEIDSYTRSRASDELPLTHALSALPHLRTLRFLLPDMTGYVLRAIGRLQCLHTLAISSPVCAQGWDDVAAAPALTSLTLSNDPHRQPELAAMLRPMPRLRALQLQHRYSYAQAWKLLVGLQAGGLEELTLADMPATNQSLAPADFQARLQAMPHLRVLRLARIANLDALLQALSATIPASLRRLELLLQPHWCDYGETLEPELELPSRAVLEQLLSAAPSLTIVLEAAASLDLWFAEADGSGLTEGQQTKEDLFGRDRSAWPRFGEGTVREQWHLLQEAIDAIGAHRK